MNFIRTSYQLLRNKLSHVHLHLHTSLSIPCCIALFISIGLSILLINFLKCSFCSFNVRSPIAECSVLPVMQDSLRIEYQSSDLCFMYSGYFFRKSSSCRVSGLLKIHEFNIVSNRIGPLFQNKCSLPLNAAMIPHHSTFISRRFLIAMSARRIKLFISEKATSYLLPISGFAAIFFLNLDLNCSYLTLASHKFLMRFVTSWMTIFKSLAMSFIFESNLEAFPTKSNIKFSCKLRHSIVSARVGGPS